MKTEINEIETLIIHLWGYKENNDEEKNFPEVEKEIVALYGALLDLKNKYDKL